MGEQESDKVRIEQRRVHVASLYEQGKGFRQIGQALEISHQQAWRDLQAIREVWRASTIRDFDAHKAAELAKIDVVEMAALTAWERSEHDATTKTRGVNGKNAVSIKKTVGQCGDPRFLGIILDCISKRCAILGLDAPSKFAETDEHGKPLDIDARRSRLGATLAAIAERGRVGGIGGSNGHSGTNGHTNGHAG